MLLFNHSPYFFHGRNPLLISSSSSPKCCCSCCCCCYAANASICSNLSPTNPSFLCKGLRQSTLIQWSFCKRLIFQGKIRQSFGNASGVSSFIDLDRNYHYEKLSSLNERRKKGFRGFGQKRKKQFLRNVSDKYVDDVDVMLNLLTDDVGLEYNDFRNRKKINKKHFCCNDKEKKILDLKQEGFVGELKGDKDFEAKSDGYVGITSSSDYRNNLEKKDHKVCIDEVLGNTDERQEHAEEQAKILGKKDNVKGYCGDLVGASQDWRKKTEKKLNEDFNQQKSNVSVIIYESISQHHSPKVDIIADESGSRMKYKRFEDNDKDKNVVIREEKHRKTDNFIRLTTGSVEKSQEILGISDTHVTKMEKTSVYEEAEQDKLKGSDNGSGSSRRKDGGSSHSSQGSGPKGPSDEMWHVTDASTQDPSEPSEPDAPDHSGMVKTSGRSLWTIVGNVVRFRWASPRSGSHTPNSGSETWFSSHEPDDSADENMKKRTNKDLDSPLPSRIISLPKIEETTFPIPAIRMRRSPGNFDEWEEAYTLEAKQRKTDEMFMREALLEAKKAADVWEVPVGAVLVKDGKIIARGYNLVEAMRDPTAHAEMICIRKASTDLRSWRLSDTTLYVTLEPCPMCAGAILQARISNIVWGAPNKLLGADGSWIRLFCDGDGGSGSILTDKPPAPLHPFHPNMAVRRGVLAAECAEVIQHFFRQRRKKKTEPELRTPPSPNRHHSNFFSKIRHAFSIIFCL